MSVEGKKEQNLGAPNCCPLPKGARVCPGHAVRNSIPPGRAQGWGPGGGVVCGTGRLSKSRVAAAVLPHVWKLLGQPRWSCACSQDGLALPQSPYFTPGSPTGTTSPCQLRRLPGGKERLDLNVQSMQIPSFSVSLSLSLALSEVLFFVFLPPKQDTLVQTPLKTEEGFLIAPVSTCHGVFGSVLAEPTQGESGPLPVHWPPPSDLTGKQVLPLVTSVPNSSPVLTCL